MNEKKAKDIMTTDVIVANKNDIIANVANLLIKEKIGGLPVVDEDNKVVGIISETDIMKKESHIDSPKMLNFLQGIIFLNDMKKFEDEVRVIAAYKVEDLMSKDIVTVKEDDTFDNNMIKPIFILSKSLLILINELIILASVSVFNFKLFVELKSIFVNKLV